MVMLPNPVNVLSVTDGEFHILGAMKTILQGKSLMSPFLSAGHFNVLFCTWRPQGPRDKAGALGETE